MNRVTSGLLVAGVILLPLGWILVVSSGYGGDSTGGSEFVWRVGGVLVYVAMPLLLLAALTHVAHLVAGLVRRRGATR